MKIGDVKYGACNGMQLQLSCPHCAHKKVPSPACMALPHYINTVHHALLNATLSITRAHRGFPSRKPTVDSPLLESWCDETCMLYPEGASGVCSWMLQPKRGAATSGLFPLLKARRGAVTGPGPRLPLPVRVCIPSTLLMLVVLAPPPPLLQPLLVSCGTGSTLLVHCRSTTCAAITLAEA